MASIGLSKEYLSELAVNSSTLTCPTQRPPGEESTCVNVSVTPEFAVNAPMSGRSAGMKTIPAPAMVVPVWGSLDTSPVSKSTPTAGLIEDS